MFCSHVCYFGINCIISLFICSRYITDVFFVCLFFCWYVLDLVCLFVCLVPWINRRVQIKLPTEALHQGRFIVFLLFSLQMFFCTCAQTKA